MKKLGTMLAVLSLVAMAPSDVYGKKTNQLKALKQENALHTSTVFNGKDRCISFVNNLTGMDNLDDFRGGFLKPYRSIQAAVSNTKAGGTIYVINTSVPYVIDLSDGPLRLKNKQALIGSSISLKVQNLTLSAQTPGKRPVIQIESPNDYYGYYGYYDSDTAAMSSTTGIVVSKGNRVSGFDIRGSGFSAGEIGIGDEGNGVESACWIDSNQFSKLYLAISIRIERNTKADIDSNRFLGTGTQLSFGSGTGRIITNMCRNTFNAFASTTTVSGIASGEETLPMLQIGAIDTTKLASRGESAQPLNGELVAAQQISSEDVAEEALSEDVTAQAALFPEVDIFLFNNTYTGFITQIGLTGKSKILAKGNKFSGVSSISNEALLVQLSNGATGFFEKNNFSHNVYGFEVILFNAGIATVTGNTFANNLGNGFQSDGFGSSSSTFNCLQLLGNKGKQETADYVLVNHSSTASFRANIRNNTGTVYVPSFPVRLVNSCPGCLKFQ